ncbi:uncharacterized protein LOC129570728 [Sitodiplosis mosellana]|uniref:uncharacterized protein LOC129570728 n=1 Tax=Sitodiplosis mosellana TaxID=263140 RepID=UPI002443C7F6|nr:uncharacterized protein LOC129570728 [Sitodiplosis mosellana]
MCIKGDRTRVVKLTFDRQKIEVFVQKGNGVASYSLGRIAIYFATCCYCQTILLPRELKHFTDHDEYNDGELNWAERKMTECIHRNPKFEYIPDAYDPFQSFVIRFEVIYNRFSKMLADKEVIVMDPDDDVWYLVEIVDLQVDSESDNFVYIVNYSREAPPNLESNLRVPVNPELVCLDFGQCEHCLEYMPGPELFEHLFECHQN